MRRFGFLLLLLSCAPVAPARTNLPIPLESDADAKISVGSCFTNVPVSGYAPITININNDSDRARVWTFHFNSPSNSFSLSNSVDSSFDFKVQGKSERSFNVLVPLALRSLPYYAPLGVTVIGPGAGPRSTQQFPSVNTSGNAPTAFVAMSSSLYSASWSQIEKELASKKRGLTGASFEPNELPDDWRALVGIAGLWIPRNELNALTPGQRGAVHDWLCQGGSLFICGATEADNPFPTAGFGKVKTISENQLVVSSTAKAIEDLRPENLEEQLNQGYAARSWTAVTTLGPIKLNVALLISFMTLFAIVVGPINLFRIAGRSNRHKLFWTTPVISLGASLLLLALIVFQDGLGGAGSRIALVHVSPKDHRDVLLQEQISRTGVLLSSAFHAGEPCFIAPISLDTSPTFSRRQNYQIFDSDFRGDWFRSRTVQAHWIESITPGRADVVLTNAAEINHSEIAPIIVSNIGGTLEHVYVRDQKGQVWGASNVHTGQKVTLSKESDIPYLLPAEAGPRLRTMWERVDGERSYFYAVTQQTSSLLATLPSIRWNNDRVIFLGPLSMPSPES